MTHLEGEHIRGVVGSQHHPVCAPLQSLLVCVRDGRCGWATCRVVIYGHVTHRCICIRTSGFRRCQTRPVSHPFEFALVSELIMNSMFFSFSGMCHLAQD